MGKLTPEQKDANRAARDAAAAAYPEKVKELFTSGAPMTVSDIVYFWNPTVDARVKRKSELTTLTKAQFEQSKEWLEFRVRIIRRDGNKCGKCGGTEHLSVHHLTYRNARTEVPQDVQTLCKGCHKAHHDEEKARNAAIEKLQRKEQRAKDRRVGQIKTRAPGCIAQGSRRRYGKRLR